MMVPLRHGAQSYGITGPEFLSVALFWTPIYLGSSRSRQSIEKGAGKGKRASEREWGEGERKRERERERERENE